MAAAAKELPKSLQQASRLAKAAVENDQQGNLAEALTLYTKAAEFLQQALQEPSLQAERHNIEKTMDSYLIRAEAIQRELSGTAPTLPYVPSDSDGTVVTAGAAGAERAVARPEGASANPTVLQVGYSALKTVNQEGGKVLLAGYHAAAQLNAEHDITGKVAAGAAATLAAVQHVNTEYRVTERVTDAVTGAYHAAVEANQKHQITQKVGTVATAAWTKTKQLNQEYKVTETIGNSLLAGLNYLSGASQQYLQSQGEAGAPTPASASATVSTQPTAPAPPAL